MQDETRNILSLDLGRLILEIWRYWTSGLGYSVLVLAALEYWISGTRTHEFQKYSYSWTSTRTSTGTSTDILWYICDVRVNTIIPLKQTVWLNIKEKFQLDLICYNLNIWYMGCDYKFHTFFQFYHHWKINWITIFMFMFIVVQSLIQLLVNTCIWKFLLQTLKKYTIFHTFHDIAQLLLSVFELATSC